MNVRGYVALIGPLKDNVSAALETVVSFRNKIKTELSTSV